MDVLAKLKPAFGKNGTVTAGNASGIVDGGRCGGHALWTKRESADSNRWGAL